MHGKATPSLSIYLSIIYLCSCSSHLEHRASVKRFVSLQFLNLGHSVGLLGKGISPSQGRYLYRTIQTQNILRQTSMMPRVGFQPRVPVFEWVKTFHALDSAATVIGSPTSSNRNTIWSISICFVSAPLTVQFSDPYFSIRTINEVRNLSCIYLTLLF
jgi:hypothetical protein